MKTMQSYSPISIPCHSGWLEKKSKHISSWRRRWAYLNGFDLYFFKDFMAVYSYHGMQPERRRYFHDDMIPKATEIIHFSLDTNAIITASSIARRYSFEIIIYPNSNKQGIISLVASSEIEYEEWMNKIQTVINIINDRKLMITKIYRDPQHIHCYYVTHQNNNNFCNDDQHNNISSRQINQNLLQYTYCFQLSVIDIEYLCSGYVAQFKCNMPCGLMKKITKYVRFELNVSCEDVTISGGSKYEYISMNICNNSIINYLFDSHIECLNDCVLINNSMLCLPQGTTKLIINNRLHIDNKSSIKHFKFSHNNHLEIVCKNDMIINSSTLITKDLDILIWNRFTMNASIIITKNVIINILNHDFNAIDSNIRSEENAIFNVKNGNLICDKTGILCNNGKILFYAQNGLIKIDGNDDIHSNISALNNIQINCYKFILNVSNKESFHPYLQCDKGSIDITTKHPNLCKFNVYLRPKSNILIENYYWNKKQPQTWLTTPIPTFDGDDEPIIFEHKYLYQFELSIEEINDIILNEMRHNIKYKIFKQLNTDWMIQCISSYTRWDLIFGFNSETLKTLFLHNNKLYQYYNIQINKGYKIMIDSDHNNNKCLNINCLNNMDLGGSIMLNEVIYGDNIENIENMMNKNIQKKEKTVINLNIDKTLRMKKDSNISINYHGPCNKWKHLLITAENDSNCTKYDGGDINISCNNLKMEENCSIDSIGNYGGNIHIKTINDITMWHNLNESGNIICSVGTSLNNGNAGNIMIECNELNLSKNEQAINSKIESIGKCNNGDIVVKANKIKGEISNIKPDPDISQYPARLFIY